MLRNESLFDLSEFSHPELLKNGDYCWEGLNLLKNYLHSYPFKPLYSAIFPESTPLPRTLILHEDNVLASEDATIEFGKTTAGELKVYVKDQLLPGASVLMAGSCFTGDRIAIGKGVLIETGALVKSPTVIGNCNEIRQGAYLRGNIVSGDGCALGHTTEIKHSIFLNGAQAGHFNYVGDSIMGNNTNLGAGTKFANFRFIKGNLFIRHDGKIIDTGRRKFGVILGDNTQTGCNSVTSPGTIIGKNSYIMPNITVRSGFHPPGSALRK